LVNKAIPQQKIIFIFIVYYPLDVRLGLCPSRNYGDRLRLIGSFDHLSQAGKACNDILGLGTA
jgi:hypothetical protein